MADQAPEAAEKTSSARTPPDLPQSQSAVSFFQRLSFPDPRISADERETRFRARGKGFELALEARLSLTCISAKIMLAWNQDMLIERRAFHAIEFMPHKLVRRKL
jgi:hypothetical protein